MIVRDEEAMLPGFLQHAQGLYDELCVVDTGSKDASMRLLSSAGAKLQQLPWRDDFAQARNAALEMATGEWICFLDADELVTPRLTQQIRSLLSDEKAGAATVVMNNRLPHGHLRTARLLRLFRNDASIRFRYAIHEDVSDSVSQYLKKTGRQQIHLSGEVEHLGYVRERAAAKDKKSRDLRLLQKCIDEDPNDLYSHFKVLELCRFWQDAPLLEKSSKDALTALRRAPAKVLSHAHYGGELLTLLAQGLHSGNAKESVQFLGQWAKKVSPSAAFHLYRGELYEKLGKHTEAEADFQRCLQLSGNATNVQLGTVRPLLGLSRLELAKGRFAQAMPWVTQALSHNARDPEALLAMVLLRRELEGEAALATFCASHRDENGATAELHAALGEEAFLRGDAAAAVREWTAAEKLSKTPQGQVRLAMSLLLGGDAALAKKHAEAASTQNPQAAIGLLLLNLLDGVDTELNVELTQAQADDAMKEWLSVLKRSRHPELWNRFRAVAPAVAEAFPWVLTWVGHR
jgi:tetratricopeptide (TPR) repeat protein